MPGPNPPTGLLPVRTALILLIALDIAAVVGVLTYLDAGTAAHALLAGLATFGVAVIGLHQLIER